MKTLSRLILLIALFTMLLCAGRALPVTAQPAVADFSQIDAYLQETMRRLPIKGMALAIVRGEQVLYMQGYGVANTQGDPATPQTPWRMGSVTKSFTALAIHQLEEAGEINVYAPVQKYLPEFHLADSRGGALVTVRNLLDHTSGISEEEGNRPYLRSPRSTIAGAIEQLGRFKPDYLPGEHYDYSNWNYVLLAQIVARVSGQSFDQYVQENILNPLGMTHSSFGDYHAIPRVATGNLISFGFSVPYDERYEPNILGAGNLTSTAEDMTHFVMLHLNGGTYQGRSLLRRIGQGWYGTMWDWAGGVPDPSLSLGLSGGYNSISTTCLFYPSQKVGVVLLLNTNLGELFTYVDSYKIARVIGDMLTSQPYQLPSYISFYLPWVILDTVFLALFGSILWQAVHLKNWRSQYHSGRASQRLIAWAFILFDLLAATFLLLFPTLMKTDWPTGLSLRPDFAIPLLILAVGHAALGIGKLGIALWPERSLSQDRKSNPAHNLNVDSV